MGMASAQYQYAHCLYDGCGVPTNKKLAVEWLRKSAAGGHAQAVEELRAFNLV